MINSNFRKWKDLTDRQWQTKAEILLTYIRTKWVFQHRLKDLKTYDSVRIRVYELDMLDVNHGPLLWDLRRRGWISFDNQGFFKVFVDGPTDPSLLQKTKRRVREPVPLTVLHKWMMGHLMHVSLPGVKDSEIPVYFRSFLNHRRKHLSTFFSVDSFVGRVHTPIVNLKGNLRFSLRFFSSVVTSLDVKQMQPTILAKVLFDSVGKNSFSDAIDKGDDIYCMLQSHANLPNRSAAKKFLFQLIFGKPMDDIGRMFDGDQHVWVDWINGYKRKVEPRNPHKDRMHTNLAWLLQFSEVQVMTEVWTELFAAGIPFLTIHDEILCKDKDAKRVSVVMNRVLKKHFKTFVVNVNAK